MTPEQAAILEAARQANGWYAVDLDRTLAEWVRWVEPDEIGPPILEMLDRVKRWLAAGKRVRIMTARVARNLPPAQVALTRMAIEKWLMKHLGQTLPITCEKDCDMLELWDDVAVSVEPNTGVQLAPSSQATGPEEPCRAMSIPVFRGQQVVIDGGTATPNGKIVWVGQCLHRRWGQADSAEAAQEAAAHSCRVEFALTEEFRCTESTDG